MSDASCGQGGEVVATVKGVGSDIGLSPGGAERWGATICPFRNADVARGGNSSLVSVVAVA